MSTEAEQLKKLKEEWYDSYYSIIYQPPGEVPQAKGPWTDVFYLAQMIGEMKAIEPQGTKFIVVSSRCGSLSPDDADQWLEMHQVQIECAKEREAYIAAGVCSQCGACSLKEARDKCRPHPLGDTGDYTCEGEGLWEDEEDPDERDSGDEDIPI